MEVSSQALKYHRVMGITYDVACFLNIGEDHISDIETPEFLKITFPPSLSFFHKQKKRRICIDSPYSKRVLESCGNCEKVITFSSVDESADVYAYDIKKSGMTRILLFVCRDIPTSLPTIRGFSASRTLLPR